MNGTGAARIDWGNGALEEVATLSGGKVEFSFRYSDKNAV